MAKNTDLFGLKRTLKKASNQNRGMRFLAVYIGLAIMISFLAVASLAPQLGEKLGTLSVKKQSQESRAAAALPNPKGPCYPMGDVDNNGTVDSVDAQKILRYVSRLPVTGTFNPRYADVDRVGGITITDALIIQRYIAGLDKTFPACPKPYLPYGQYGL